MWAILNPEIYHICLKKNVLNVTFRAPYEIQVVILLIVAYMYININNIKTLVNCYFYRYDEANITLRKRVDLSH